MIALSCGIKISAVPHLVLIVTIHACDRQTDRQTDGQTDRITTPKTALAYARAVKTRSFCHEIIYYSVALKIGNRTQKLVNNQNVL